MAEAAQPDYGVESPRLVRSMFSRGAWTLAFAIALFFINRTEYPGPSVRLLVVLSLIGVGFLIAGYSLLWSSRVARFQVRDTLLDDLALKGDERVLDFGSGRGLMLIGAAKRMKSGRITGVDLSGDADAARENAKLEGIADKVRVDPADTVKLKYPDAHYDAVVSALALYRLDYNSRRQAIQEMWRVLKPGGRLAIFDPRYISEYAATLRAAGAQNVDLEPVSFFWGLPGKRIKVTK
jgi:arsenite methyltransferase